jgi:hypothetical protein
MTQAETAAQAALRQIAKELSTIRRRLIELHESLPPASLEAIMFAGEEDLDVTTEVRTIIECVIQDSLLPAIRDLEAAANYQPDNDKEKEDDKGDKEE